MRALFARELRTLAPMLAETFGNFGLFLRAHADARNALPAHRLGAIVELCPLSDGQLQGDVQCMTGQLPFASECFNCVIAQHAFEHSSLLAENVVEVARVLAPEGLALVFGFNPLGSWRPWLEWRRRREGVPLHLHSAHTWRKLLLREQVDTVQVNFPGLWLPRGDKTRPDPNPSRGRDARFGSSWLLVARKRRSTLTPLRPRLRIREMSLRPRLVPGAQRAHT